MTTRFLLVRHAQSVWNATGRWQGRADPPLTATGRQQAMAAAAALGAVDAVIASPQERARDTAAIIAEAIGIGPVITDDRLVESDAGAWTGLTRAEIDADWPGWLKADRRPDDFEDPETVLGRAVSSLRSLSHEFPDATLFVVTHSGLMRVLDKALGMPDGPVHHLCGRWYDAEGDRLVAGDRVDLIDVSLKTTLGPAHTENN